MSAKLQARVIDIGEAREARARAMREAEQAAKRKADAVRVWRQQMLGRPGETDNRTVSNIAGLAVSAVLVLLGLLIVQALIDESWREDCLMTHRRNCDQLMTLRH